MIAALSGGAAGFRTRPGVPEGGVGEADPSLQAHVDKVAFAAGGNGLRGGA